MPDSSSQTHWSVRSRAERVFVVRKKGKNIHSLKLDEQMAKCCFRAAQISSRLIMISILSLTCFHPNETKSSQKANFSIF